MTRNLDYTQQSYISILFAKNYFIEKICIKPEELDYPYSKFLDLFIKSYSRYKLINMDFLLRNLTFEEQSTILEVISDLVSTEFSYFVSLEKIIQERSIQNSLEENITLYQEERISLDELRKRLTIDNKNLTELLTAEDLNKTLTIEQRIIDFAGFQRTRSLLNLRQTDLCVIAAYTGKGKTALGLNIMEDLSRNYEVFYVNLEMGISSLRRRILAINSGYKVSELERFNFLSEERKKEISDKTNFIKDRKIYISNGSKSISDLRELVASRGNKHCVFIIDHIGLLNSDGRSLYEKMTNVAKELRKMCLDYNVTIIALCQLSRQGAKGQPDLSMLRDSGEIEQSATKVIFLYSEDSINGEEYYINIAKNRDGMTGKIPIRFEKTTQRIFEL